MNIDCEFLVRSYADWLRAKFTTKDINGICEITTPFLDRHNDRLQLYVEKTSAGFVSPMTAIFWAIWNRRAARSKRPEGGSCWM